MKQIFECDAQFNMSLLNMTHKVKDLRVQLQLEGTTKQYNLVSLKQDSVDNQLNNFTIKHNDEPFLVSIGFAATTDNAMIQIEDSFCWKEFQDLIELVEPKNVRFMISFVMPSLKADVHNF